MKSSGVQRPAIDENTRRRFERAWLLGHPLPIDECLPNASDPRRLPTLEELVCVDLEFAWKASRNRSNWTPPGSVRTANMVNAHPRIEDYVRQYPALGERDVLQRLIQHEIQIRQAIGEHCTVSEYAARFPELERNDRTLPHIPGYIVESEVGRGGMGVVYSCRQSATNERVALKLMLSGRQAGFEALARFRIEAEALACLDHRNVSRVIAVGVVHRCPYIVTEYATNGTIRDYSRRAEKSIEWCVDAVRQIALGMQHAHSRSMIHRDIKPANILIMEDETPKVTDFGLVKFRTRIRDLAAASRTPRVDGSFYSFDLLLDELANDPAMQYDPGNARQSVLVHAMHRACLARTGLPEASIDLTNIQQFLETLLCPNTDDVATPALPPCPELDDLTDSGTWIGSPQFMSPEQVVGNSATIGPQTDVYSLGATLYWLLTGVPVATGADLPELFRKIRTEFPKPLQELNPRVPLSVECVIWKAIQKDLPRRYASCELLAEELQCCLDGRKPAALKSRERSMERMTIPIPDNKNYDDLFLKAFPPRAD